MRFLFTILFTILISPFVFSQAHPHCGTSLESFERIKQRLLENKAFLKKHPIVESRNAISYVPIKLHLVGQNDGSDRIEYSRVLDQVCFLNEVFQDLDMVFYIKDGFNEVDDTQIYFNDQNSNAESRMFQHRDNRALNIWVLGEVNTSNTSGRILGVYDDNADWIKIINGSRYFGIGAYTLLHEIGHFFGLLHPFYGWEINPYTQDLEGRPAPIKAPNFDVLTEYVDGRNCNNAGDFICDTPAEYYYAYYLNSNGDTITNLNNRTCQYDRPMQDPVGETLSPDPSLIMGYFLDNCISHFTSQQMSLMQSDLQSRNRSYLRTGYAPTTSRITASPQLLAPINSAVTPNYNKVALSWENMPNATRYLVEVSRIPGFSNSLQYISATNSLVVEDLDADRTYFWRVKPYNEHFTCSAPSSSGRFRTGISTSIPIIDKVNDWKVYPNPANASDGLVLEVQADAAFTADVKIYTFAGVLIQELSSISFTNGASQAFINLEKLSAGMYFIHLENDTGVLNSKIIVE